MRGCGAEGRQFIIKFAIKLRKQFSVCAAVCCSPDSEAPRTVQVGYTVVKERRATVSSNALLRIQAACLKCRCGRAFLCKGPGTMCRSEFEVEFDKAVTAADYSVR